VFAALAAFALLAGQDPGPAVPSHQSPGFSFPQPDAAVLVTESANGQVFFVELRQPGQESGPAFLKLFSIPNQGGALDAATLLGLGAQEFGGLAAAAGLAGGPIAEGVMAVPGGEAATRSQEFRSADGLAVARSRFVLLQTAPMAAGALIWIAPGQPDGLLGQAEAVLAGIQVLAFDAEALQPVERHGIRFALPLLWVKEEQEQPGTASISCQGMAGSVFASAGSSGMFGGWIGEAFILDNQRADADQIASRFGGSVVRQNACMRLAGEQLHVGQRFQIRLQDGTEAEIRNAVFSDEGLSLCLIGALYAAVNRPAMLGWIDRMAAAVTMPQRVTQQIETRSWSGISVRFPERLEVEQREPGAFLPGGWKFTIPHDDDPAGHSFELRVWREDAPAAGADAQKELRASLDDLTKLWTAAEVADASPSAGEAFGRPADVLQATLTENGLTFLVDARRVATAGGVYRSLAIFPADLAAEHRPVLDLILERSSLWTGEEPLATTHGARIRIPDPSWVLRDYRSGGSRCFALSNATGIVVQCAPEPDLTPDFDLAAELAVDYYAGDEVQERLDLQMAGGTLPAVRTFSTFDDEGREVTMIEFHALTVHEGLVWHLAASGTAEQRAEILAALAGIALPGR